MKKFLLIVTIFFLASNAVAVVMVGDLTTGHAEDYALFEQHLPNRDSLPSFLIPGNHDLYFNGWEEFYTRFGSSTYFFTIRTTTATDLFICLDSGGGTLGNLQLDWLKEMLENTSIWGQQVTILKIQQQDYS